MPAGEDKASEVMGPRTRGSFKAPDQGAGIVVFVPVQFREVAIGINPHFFVVLCLYM